jgi:putative redox protein
MVTVHWNGNMVFTGVTPTGNKLVMDAYPEEGEVSAGPTPLEAFLAAGAACSAMDVVSILEKKKQKITHYRVEIEGERAPHGAPYPRPYTSLTIKHFLEGEDLDEAAVKRAIELTDEKYCSVIATLRATPPISSIYEIKTPVS